MSQKRLPENEKQFRQLVDIMPQMVWVADPDGTINYYNRYWYDYTGLPAGSENDSWQKSIHPEEFDSVCEVWQRHLKTGKSYELQFRIREGRSGQYRWHLCRAVPVLDDHKKITFWVGTNTDIDDQKKSEEQLILAKSQSEDSNRAKSEFLANMSHKIRTPLNAIMGLSSILGRSSPLSNKQKDFIHTLQTSADSMLTLINDLLDISRIETQTIEFEKIPFDLTQILEETMAMMENESREKGLKLTMDTSCIHDQILAGDPARLRQVILNLCSNAIKFTDSGGVHIAVACQPISSENTQNVSISVADTGIGIPQEEIDSIFEKYVRRDTEFNRKYGSAGLGLAMTRTLTESMGGKLTVESTIGKGSVFTLSLTFPVIKIDRLSAFSKAVGNGSSPVDEEQKILIVEDYAPNVMVTGSFLEEFGYSYDVAPGGKEAIDKIKDNDYRAILMDVQMPGINGLETTQAIRTYENLLGKQPLHIIGVTAHAMPGDRERCLEAGMDDYLSKPFSPNQLKNKLAKSDTAQSRQE